MAAYKRSDPSKLAADRAAIAKQMAAHDVAEAPKESLGSLAMRALKQLDDQIKAKVQQNRDRAEGYGGRPVLNGAKVTDEAQPMQTVGATMVGIQKRKKSTA